MAVDYNFEAVNLLQAIKDVAQDPHASCKPLIFGFTVQRILKEVKTFKRVHRVPIYFFRARDLMESQERRLYPRVADGVRWVITCLHETNVLESGIGYDEYTVSRYKLGKLKDWAKTTVYVYGFRFIEFPTPTQEAS